MKAICFSELCHGFPVLGVFTIPNPEAQFQKTEEPHQSPKVSHKKTKPTIFSLLPKPNLILMNTKINGSVLFQSHNLLL